MAKKSSCGELFPSLAGAIYNNTVFSRFFEQNDPIVLGWAENVLAKLTAEGILPTFLQKKDNEDFKAYWGTITHLFALIVIYSRKYKEIDSNKILFDTFIQNKGLITDLVDSQGQMEYLFYNYLEEYNKRGRLDIIGKEGEILGELLRLIRYNSLDEFIFALLQPQNTGWVMGHSSPSWRRTNTIVNVTKAYEFTEDIVDLTKYPLLRSANVSLTNDRDIDNRLVKVMTFSGVQTVGIQSDPIDISKHVLIDPNISYEISMKIKISGLQNQNLKFGAIGYDSDHNPLNFSVLENANYASESNWFHSDTFLHLINENIYYEIKGIVLAYNQRYLSAPELNFPTGRALSMKQGMNFISPVLIQERVAATNPFVYIYDFKIKPLELPFEQGYLGERDIIASYYKNNAFQRENTINLFLKKYLISYKNVFGGEMITPLKESLIVFKVFSDRNQYIQNAIITINGTSYITNINGEVSLSLYPGTYLYNVDASEFDSILGTTITVNNEDRAEYIQLAGTVYQRSIAFLVRSGSSLVENAKVTFNQQTKFTGTNGLVFFEAFPGIYAYKIEKTDYFPISRNVNITESTTIEVDLLPIPYYNVSFRVRDGINPVSGAAVIITGDFDGDGIITEQTGSTNLQGIASGFTMRAGTYSYKVSKVGFIPIGNDFSIVNNATIEVPISPVPKYNVTFVVKNNALPVANVSVNFNGVSKLTDTLGKAIFQEPDGDYNYNVTKTEFLTQNGALSVNGEDIIKNIDFIQIGYLVKFIVKVKGSGSTFLPGVKITTGAESITTNTSGEAEFIRVSGSYNWTATLAGYYQEGSVVVVNGGNKTVTVEMTLITYNAIFTVRVNGQTLAGQPVICNGKSISTDYQGIAKFNLPPGSYGWSVTRTSYDPQAGTVLLIDRDVAVNVDLLATKGIIVFTAKDSVSGTLLNNVAITINGETKYTAATGQVSFTLVLGNYNYVAGVIGYNSNEGTVKVIEGSSTKEILMVKEAEKQYPLTFTAKEGSSLLSGVNISLDNGMTGTTNSTSGQAVFSVISGSYNYTAIYNSFFDPLQGLASVSGSATNVPLNFVRKTTSVTFKIKDSLSGAAVSAVSVEFNNQTKTTNTLGDVTFTGIPLSSTSMRYVASKNPPYKDVVGTLVVNTENPTVNITMGQYSYKATFTVKTNTGVAISNAYISCNGRAGYTLSSGQLSLDNFITGTYPYTVTNSAYQTVTGNITINNAEGFANVVMVPLNNATKIHVQINSSTPVQGVSVQVGSNTIATDSNGDASFSLRDGNYSYTVGGNSNYFPVTGSFTVASLSQTITATLEDVFTLEISNPSNFSFTLPITNSSSNGLSQMKVDWGDGVTTTGQKQHTYGASGSGRRLKISMGSSGGTLQWGFQNAYSTAGSAAAGDVVKAGAKIVTRILQWFQTTSRINFLDGGFAFCTNLNSLGTIKGSQCSGMPSSFLKECKALRSIPDGLFNWQSNNGDFTDVCRGAGLTGNIGPGFLIGVTTIIEISYAFAETNISSVTFVFPNFALSATRTFWKCPYLTSCTAFNVATRVSSLSNTFAECGNLNVWPTIKQINIPVDMTGTFKNCANLPGNGIANYLPRTATSCIETFSGCSKITSFASGLMSPKTTSMDHCFFKCSSLTNITNTKVPSDGGSYHVVSMNYTYALSGVTSIPVEFFRGMSSVLSFVGTFESCRSLTNINAGVNYGIFGGCAPKSMSGCFYNCINLNSSINSIFGWYGTPTASTQSVARSCTNYNSCFENCTNLTSEAPYLTPEIQIFYIYEWGGKVVKNGSSSLYTLPYATGTSCFKGCTKMAYYSSIPSSWK